MKKLIVITALLLVGCSASLVPASVRTPTAQCRDGEYSYSQSRQGTCSHHGGVEHWIK